MSVLFLWRPLISLVKGEIWRVVVVFLEEDLLEKPEDLSDCEPEIWVDVCAVPDVSVVPVSPSSVFTGCFGDVSLELDWGFVEPQSPSLSKKRTFWTVSREEMRSESSAHSGAFRRDLRARAGSRCSCAAVGGTAGGRANALPRVQHEEEEGGPGTVLGLSWPYVAGGSGGRC